MASPKVFQWRTIHLPIDIVVKFPQLDDRPNSLEIKRKRRVKIDFLLNPAKIRTEGAVRFAVDVTRESVWNHRIRFPWEKNNLTPRQFPQFKNNFRIDLNQKIMKIWSSRRYFSTKTEVGYCSHL